MVKPNNRESLANKYSIDRLKSILENYKPHNKVKGNLNGMYVSGDGEKYVRIRIDGEKVRRSHIVWRITHNQLIPIGYNIHHKDENKRNDSPDNLELIKEVEHSKLNLKGKNGNL